MIFNGFDVIHIRTSSRQYVFTLKINKTKKGDPTMVKAGAFFNRFLLYKIQTRFTLVVAKTFPPCPNNGLELMQSLDSSTIRKKNPRSNQYYQNRI